MGHKKEMLRERNAWKSFTRNTYYRLIEHVHIDIKEILSLEMTPDTVLSISMLENETEIEETIAHQIKVAERRLELIRKFSHSIGSDAYYTEADLLWLLRHGIFFMERASEDFKVTRKRLVYEMSLNDVVYHRIIGLEEE